MTDLFLIVHFNYSSNDVLNRAKINCYKISVQSFASFKNNKPSKKYNKNYCSFI